MPWLIGIIVPILQSRRLRLDIEYLHNLPVSEVSQSCLILCDPMDCSLPGSSIHAIFHARILEWVSISFSMGPSWPRDQTRVSDTAGRLFTIWATREAQITCIVSCHLNIRSFCLWRLLLLLELYGSQSWNSWFWALPAEEVCRARSGCLSHSSLGTEAFRAMFQHFHIPSFLPPSWK